jgi:hypothetical protein
VPAIDGEGWIAERMKFLRERLTGELSDEDRQATESEIEVLSKEGSIIEWTRPTDYCPMLWAVGSRTTRVALQSVDMPLVVADSH